MRRTYWYVLFVNVKDGVGQPAFVQGGRRFKAIRRVAAKIGKGWKLDLALRMRGRPANLGFFPPRYATVEEFIREAISRVSAYRALVGGTAAGGQDSVIAGAVLIATAPLRGV